MVLAFERSTYVYQFTPGQGPRVVSDTRACEWHTDAETVYACTMFDGDGVVQVRHAAALATRRAAPPRARHDSMRWPTDRLACSCRCCHIGSLRPSRLCRSATCCVLC